ncbi:MAG: hypothetical protein JSV86_05530 [Gemmatimonadota bacterium]|nr:MAG: hypothetical protein JSV86_05530 [Gemmatimonadota bacterium]
MTKIEINTDDLCFSAWAEVNLTQMQNVLGFLLRVLIDKQSKLSMESDPKLASAIEGLTREFLEDVDFSEYMDHDKISETVVEGMDVDDVARLIWRDRDDEIKESVWEQIDNSEIAEHVDVDYGELAESIEVDQLAKSLIDTVRSCPTAKQVVRDVMGSTDVTLGDDEVKRLASRIWEDREGSIVSALRDLASLDWGALRTRIERVETQLSVLKSHMREGLRHMVSKLID